MEGESSHAEMKWQQHLARVKSIHENAEDRLAPGEIIRLAELLDTQEHGELTPEDISERTALMQKLGGKEEEGGLESKTE